MIRLITDSVSDIPKELRDAYEIIILPLKVNFGDISYRDCIDISPEEFFKKLKSVDKLPTTSQVNVAEFTEVFEKIIKAGDEAIVITISSNLSGTYNSAVMAKEEIETDRINIVDSKSVSLGEGLLVIKAAEMARAGKSRDEIVAKCKDLISRQNLIIFVDTLKYLQKGGRLTVSEAFIGNLLNIKPILAVENGVLVAIDKVHGRNKMMKWFEEYLHENNSKIDKAMAAFMHAADPVFMEEMIEVTSEVIQFKKLYRGMVGSVVGTHSGPGCIGFCYFRKSEK